jgi:oligopeptide transport system permease protein
MNTPIARSPIQIAMIQLRRNRMAMAGAVILIVMTTASMLAPVLPIPAEDAISLENSYQPPSLSHWLGTDPLGRDMLSRTLNGLRRSLLVGIAATLVSLIIGVSYGAVAGFSGGRTDNLMMRIVDILYGLPFMFIVIILLVIAGQSFINLFIALGAVQWLTMSRIVRGQVLSVKEKEYVEAAMAMGSSRVHILARHIIPNVLGPIIVYSTLMVPAIILEESFLSFLGLGIPDPYSSLGKLCKMGADNMDSYPWLLIFPSAVMMVILFSLNFLGDGLRDALDPQLKK